MLQVQTPLVTIGKEPKNICSKFSSSFPPFFPPSRWHHCYLLYLYRWTPLQLLLKIQHWTFLCFSLIPPYVLLVHVINILFFMMISVLSDPDLKRLMVMIESLLLHVLKICDSVSTSSWLNCSFYILSTSSIPSCRRFADIQLVLKKVDRSKS